MCIPNMSTTYTTVEIARPGVLSLVERALPEPAPGQVRIRVEACGNLPLGFGRWVSGWPLGSLRPAASLNRLFR